MKFVPVVIVLIMMFAGLFGTVFLINYCIRPNKSYVSQSYPEFITFVSDQTLTAKQKDILKINKSKNCVSVQPIKLNVDLLKNSTLSFTLDGTSYKFTRINKANPEPLAMNSVDFEGQNGDAAFYIDGKIVLGGIWTNAFMYQIVPIGDGLHCLIKIDPVKNAPPKDH